jgi:hypothetical protein
VAAQFARNGNVRTFGEGGGELSQVAKATHRCHSVRDSHAPASFFHEVLVASENSAMFVASLTFLSASPPRKPIRVILLITYVSPDLPVCLGHPEASVRGSQDHKPLFWGARGSQNWAEGKAAASQAPGAARAPSSAETKGRTGNGPETVPTGFVGASETQGATRNCG